MTPAEIKQITDSLTEVIKTIETDEGGSGYAYIYIIVAAIPTFVLIGRQIRKAFVKAIEKVMETHIKQMDSLMKSMNLRTEELGELSKSHEEVKEKVDEHHSFIDKFKDKCG
jgi:ABC-type enterochelin transport system substrate-binding protein